MTLTPNLGINMIYGPMADYENRFTAFLCFLKLIFKPLELLFLNKLLDSRSLIRRKNYEMVAVDDL